MEHQDNPDRCFQAILLKWLQGQPEPEIAGLLEALQSPVVGRKDVADEVETCIDQSSW